jgi:hypothetical protein
MRLQKLLVPLQHCSGGLCRQLWCASHPLFKWKRKLSQQVLARVQWSRLLRCCVCAHQVPRPSRKGFPLPSSSQPLSPCSVPGAQSSAHCAVIAKVMRCGRQASILLMCVFGLYQSPSALHTACSVKIMLEYAVYDPDAANGCDTVLTRYPPLWQPASDHAESVTTERGTNAQKTPTTFLSLR